MKRKNSKGFTLTEMMMAIVISAIVFSAMATLLSRCFSLWLEAQAQWKLAQHARVTRLQILNGGFGLGTGVISASNVTVSAYGSWRKVTFHPVGGAGEYAVYGWPGTSAQNVWLQNPDGDWAWAQNVSQYGSSEASSVLVNDFSAEVTNQTIRMSYTLTLSAIGRTFELPQLIETHLVNNE